MRNLSLLFILASTEITASTLDGWFNCGATGKYAQFKLHEFSLNNDETPKEEINHIHLNSAGVEAEVGLIFPCCPFFLAIEGSYTRLYSSTFANQSINQGTLSVSPTVQLGGDFYTCEVKGGYLFQPLCDIQWGLYPVFSYNTDSVRVKLLRFPGDVPSEVVINLFNFRPRVALRGPALGFGTTFELPYGISVWAEGSWQWRHTTLTSNNQFHITIPTVMSLSAQEKKSSSLWAQGPKVDLNLEYTYCNWFIGIGGEWQYLKQFGKSEGQSDESDLITPLQSQQQKREFSISPLVDKDFSWSNWNWKAYVGYDF